MNKFESYLADLSQISTLTELVIAKKNLAIKRNEIVNIDYNTPCHLCPLVIDGKYCNKNLSEKGNYCQRHQFFNEPLVSTERFDLIVGKFILLIQTKIIS
jgi:hypothetical protein